MWLLADPIILLSPADNATENEWLEYHDYLTSCVEIKKQNNYDIILSEICYDALLLSDRYPKSDKDLQKKLKAAGVVAIDARMLYSIIRSIGETRDDKKLMERLELTYDDTDEDFFEIIKGGDSILISKNEITIDPQVVLNRLVDDVKLMKALQVTLATIVYVTQSEQIIEKDKLSILTIASNETNASFTGIRVSAIISDPKDSTQNTSIETIVTPQNLLELADHGTIIMNHYPNIGEMFKTYCNLVDKRDFTGLVEYQFAESFLESMNELYLNQQKESEILKIFRGLVRVLNYLIDIVPCPPRKEKDNHPIVDKSHQIKTDQDWQAWRAHISGKDYRLHYWWNKKTHQLIFSVIRTHHNDLTIPQNKKEKDKYVLV